MLDLSRLSPAQRAAVLTSDDPLLILAGPGSGKTTVLAARIASLVAARGVPPTSILALTFATKAARELRLRLGGLLGPVGTEVDVSTFHAFGLRVIRQWSEVLGWGSGPVGVYGADEAGRVLRDVAAELGIDHDRWPIRELTARLERHRLGDEPKPSGGFALLNALGEQYEAVLRRRRVVDYPAMLALPLRLFAARPESLRLLQTSYRYVLCDEFQDVSAAQYRLLLLLAQRHRNLVVVGDPQQTLYGWRGADVRFLRAFRTDLPEARVLSLDQNFRATGHLVEFANAVGAPLPYARRLWTDNPPGEPARLQIVADEDAEASFVARTIASLCSKGQVEHPGEVAVLYRTNRQADPVALALREEGVPYHVKGSADLLARREVRDALAYLRLAHNPADTPALVRIANVPPRRLGRLREVLRAEPAPADQLPLLAERFGQPAAAAAEALAALIAELHICSTSLSPAALLDLALERSGYRAWLAQQPDGDERLANVAALRTLAAGADGGLATWLAELHLDEDGSPIENARRVLLTTVHGAKGGEWRWVFVLGVEEGLLPHARALRDEPGDENAIQAERRVAYVAVTRPREGLYLLCCRTRRRGERREPRHPSRFLRDLPLERAA